MSNIEISKLSLKVVVECLTEDVVRLLTDSKCPVQIKPSFLEELTIKLSYANGRTRSLGGLDASSKPYISLNLKKYLVPKDVSVFTEYKSHKNDPLIGSFEGAMTDCLKCLIAHELAHVAQHTLISKESMVVSTRFDSKEMGMPHGAGWKAIYRYLRTELNLINLPEKVT